MGATDRLRMGRISMVSALFALAASLALLSWLTADPTSARSSVVSADAQAQVIAQESTTTTTMAPSDTVVASPSTTISAEVGGVVAKQVGSELASTGLDDPRLSLALALTLFGLGLVAFDRRDARILRMCRRELARALGHPGDAP